MKFDKSTMTDSAVHNGIYNPEKSFGLLFFEDLVGYLFNLPFLILNLCSFRPYQIREVPSLKNLIVSIFGTILICLDVCIQIPILVYAHLHQFFLYTVYVLGCLAYKKFQGKKEVKTRESDIVNSTKEHIFRKNDYDKMDEKMDQSVNAIGHESGYLSEAEDNKSK